MYDTTLDPISPDFNPSLFEIPTVPGMAIGWTPQIAAPLAITTDGFEVPVSTEHGLVPRTERAMIADVLWHASRAKPRGARLARRNIRPLGDRPASTTNA